MKRRKLLDLCCKAGGASMGYYRAGFEVTGVDNQPQKRYPFRFILADAIQYLGWLIKTGEIEEYDAVAASWPCQRWSELTPSAHKDKHPDLIKPGRELMIATKKPYIIENVEGARGELINPVMLCGSMFGLPIWRHRYFENNFGLFLSPAGCNHDFVPVVVSGVSRRTQPILISGRGMRQVEGRRRKEDTAEIKRQAMETPWMVEVEVTQAVPPAYTEWIGRQLIEHLEANAA
jgi:DNA (cytosine-5)-methyltransferase 1